MEPATQAARALPVGWSLKVGQAPQVEPALQAARGPLRVRPALVDILQARSVGSQARPVGSQARLAGSQAPLAATRPRE